MQRQSLKWNQSFSSCSRVWLKAYAVSSAFLIRIQKESLAKPGRNLVRSGRLRERQSSGKEAILRCYLFTDLLLLCQVHKGAGKMEIREKIYLSDLKITVLADAERKSSFD